MASNRPNWRARPSLSPPLKRWGNIASVDYNESHLPRRLGSFTDQLSRVGGTLRPTQEMVNLISEDIARGEANPQPFAPFVAADYRQRP